MCCPASRHFAIVVDNYFWRRRDITFSVWTRFVERRCVSVRSFWCRLLVRFCALPWPKVSRQNFFISRTRFRMYFLCRRDDSPARIWRVRAGIDIPNSLPSEVDVCWWRIALLSVCRGARDSSGIVVIANLIYFNYYCRSLKWNPPLYYLLYVNGRSLLRRFRFSAILFVRCCTLNISSPIWIKSIFVQSLGLPLRVYLFH